jgi:N-methylhydantoinase A
MHACALVAELRLKKVIIPRYPGHFSAWAMLATEPRRDLIQTRVRPTSAVDDGEVAGLFAAMEAELGSALAREGRNDAPIAMIRGADMRYAGQDHTVKVPIGNGATVSHIEADFHALHRKQYTFELPDSPIEFVNYHVTALQQVRKPAVAEIASSGRSAERAFEGERRVDLDVFGIRKAPVYDRDRLPAGFQRLGPLIVEEQASTTLVYPDQTLEVDRYGNLIVHPRT